MLALMENIDATLYTPLIYMLASTDDTSLRRVQAQQQARRADAVYKLPRSREVGQSYVSSIFTTLWSFLIALYYVAVIRPDLLLCNGPGTCLPVAIATLWYRILGLCRGNIVFCESFCRVTSFSLTGRLLYPIVDMFVVHWKELQQVYPNCRVVSTFVPNNNTIDNDGKKKS
jgi:beta-1,4-N-acetylglucosaminyltransferase